MKNKYWFTILTAIVAAVFLLSLFSTVSAAQKPANNPHPGVGLGNQNGNLVKLQNIGQKFEDAKQQFEDALNQFNAKGDSKSKGVLIQRTQDYLGSAIDRIESYLNVQKAREADIGIKQFNASDDMDAQIAQLEQLRTKMQNDSTIEELREDNKELKDIYANISLETQYRYEIMLENRINTFISKSGNVSASLNTAIQNTASKGKDTSRLEEFSSNFAQLMQQATAEQQGTEALLTNHTGFDDSGNVINGADAQVMCTNGKFLIKETVSTLKDAEKQLQDFVREYRRLGGNAEDQQGNAGEHEKLLASGNSTLVANGSGRAVIIGNVTVMLSGINDTLIVSNNSNVTTDGGTNQTLGNGHIEYQGFNSSTITGYNIRVALSGNNISLTVTCTDATTACNAVLNGNGTFSISGTGNLSVSGEWWKGNSVTVTPPDE